MLALPRKPAMKVKGVGKKEKTDLMETPTQTQQRIPEPCWRHKAKTCQAKMKTWSIRGYTEEQPLYPLFHSLLTRTKQNRTFTGNSPHSWLLFPPYITWMAALPQTPNPRSQIQMPQSSSAFSAEPCWTFRLLLHAGLAAGCTEAKEILFLWSPGPEFRVWTLACTQLCSWIRWFMQVGTYTAWCMLQGSQQFAFLPFQWTPSIPTVCMPTEWVEQPLLAILGMPEAQLAKETLWCSFLH